MSNTMNSVKRRLFTDYEDVEQDHQERTSLIAAATAAAAEHGCKTTRTRSSGKRKLTVEDDAVSNVPPMAEIGFYSPKEDDMSVLTATNFDDDHWPSQQQQEQHLQRSPRKKRRRRQPFPGSKKKTKTPYEDVLKEVQLVWRDLMNDLFENDDEKDPIMEQMMVDIMTSPCPKLKKKKSKNKLKSTISPESFFTP